MWVLDANLTPALIRAPQHRLMPLTARITGAAGRARRSLQPSARTQSLALGLGRTSSIASRSAVISRATSLLRRRGRLEGGRYRGLPAARPQRGLGGLRQPMNHVVEDHHAPFFFKAIRDITLVLPLGTSSPRTHATGPDQKHKDAQRQPPIDRPQARRWTPDPTYRRGLPRWSAIASS